MTPKEKAEEIVNKIKNGLWKDRGVNIYSEDAIYCALIAVDEISQHCYQVMKPFWEEVKNEIEKL